MKILAIDIGGSKMRFGVYDKTLTDVYVVKTPKNKKEFLKKIEDICKAHKDVVKAAAICFPGVVAEGKIVHLPNLSFMDNTEIVKFVQKYIKKVKIDNDAKSYMRAELHKGAARNSRNAVLLAIGTGVGGAISVNKEIYYGQGAAGEFGHIVLDNGKTLEQLASGKSAIKHRIEDFKRLSKYFGMGMANIINILNPELIVITGGFGQAQASKFLPEAIKQMKKYIVSPQAKNTPVVLGKLGPEAALLGAALLFK